MSRSFPPVENPRVVYAGDRDVSVEVLDVLLENDVSPVALLLSSPDRASHDSTLRKRCPHLSETEIFRGRAFQHPGGMNTLRALNPDFLLSVHFPYVIPPEVLALPEIAPLNLHPAYLPYNRGWHTPSWALLENTPIGATLHVMTSEVDAGPIVNRSRLSVRPDDTAHTLYQRIKALEVEVFENAWPRLQAGTVDPTLPSEDGSLHNANDLHDPAVQRINRDERLRAGALIDRLRALTTNRTDEAAYFEQDGTRYRVQISITPDPEASSSHDTA